jgi:hypothetical protein
MFFSEFGCWPVLKRRVLFGDGLYELNGDEFRETIDS